MRRIPELNVDLFDPILAEPDLRIKEDIESVVLQEGRKLCRKILIRLHMRVADENLRHCAIV